MSPHQLKKLDTTQVRPWPALMRAETAAAYMDEKSVKAFRRAVGPLYPKPIRLPGKGDRWLKDALDAVIDRLVKPKGSPLKDIADLIVS